MKDFLMTFETEELLHCAQPIFMRICGFDPAVFLHQKMMSEAMPQAEALLAGKHMLASACCYEAFSLQDTSLAIGEAVIDCRYFAQIAADSPSLVWVFSLAAQGSMDGEETPIMQVVYTDFWGTAFIEAASVLLRTQIAAYSQTLTGKNNVFLSELFGPGYYGTDPGSTATCLQLSEGDRIGIGLSESGIMIPEKSCTGLFFASDRPFSAMPAGCADCRGKTGICTFCSSYGRQDI